MPIYEYQCKQCGHQGSDIDSINAPRTKKCPSCGKRAFSRLISASSFQLKGSGWYVTDFRNKAKTDDKSPAAKSEKTDAGDAKKKVKKNTGQSDKKSPEKAA